MSTADAQGTAGPVTALAGPPLADSQAAGVALFEVAAAEERLSRAKASLAKITDRAEQAEADAQERVSQAQADLDAEVARTRDLTGITDPARLRSLASDLAAEQERHQAALTGLLAGED